MTKGMLRLNQLLRSRNTIAMSVLPAAVPAGTALQYRVVLKDGEQGRRPADWTPISSAALNLQDGAFHLSFIVPAGGWYRLELATLDDDAGPHAFGAAQSLGVGEVLVIAGQSYATNDERLRIRDPQERISALNVANPAWAAAHDPQLTPDRSDGGSIRHAVGDSPLQEFHVPIGFSNVTFSTIGQRRAAAVWHEVLCCRLNETPTGIDAATCLIRDDPPQHLSNALITM